ncbi:unnamed protein product [Clavelina lepadiformis]|uniref:JmjC domain-containing protein n=1 Tax=Clavelina lepadiformis TaxID=159417 RepID=A0ABP0GJ55_CLALP
MFIHVISLLAFFILPAKADILFPKDTSVNFIFPPNIHRSSTGIPDGHLRPLGWQRSPEGKILEVTSSREPKQFWEENVKDKIPLVVRNGFNQSSECFTMWDDKHLKGRYGGIKIEVTTKKPGKIVEPQIMTLKKFLLRYNLEDWYLVSPIPDEMLHQIPLSPSLACGTFKQYLQEPEIWMSSGGTSSKLHYDADHNLHCMITGRKDVIMVDSKYKGRLEMEEDKAEGTGYSNIDMEMVNMYEHPQVGKTSWKWTTLWPGDCIFIPSGHLHQVRSYGRSLSIATLWTPTREFNDSDCAVANSTEQMFMDEANYVWKLYDGERLINTDNYDKAEVLRHHLMSLLRDDPRLTRERFFLYFEKARNEVSRQKKQTPHAAFRQLDLKKKNFLTERDIKKLSGKLLERVTSLYIRPSMKDDEKILRDEL